MANTSEWTYPASSARAIKPCLPPPPRLPLLRRALLLLALACVSPAEAATFEVSPDGSPYSISTALAEAGAGDTVVLSDGKYDEPIVTVQGGDSGSPLTITGGRGAVVNADYDGKAVLVTHSWVTLEGFSVDGKVGDDDEASSHVDKCVFVEGPSTTGDEVLEGFIMQDVAIANCGDECVRLKNFVIGAHISENVIEDCGVRDYVYGNSGKNGEGIYVGTSSTQWDDGPDECSDNIIMDNIITPNGNECVDIKEGSTGTIVEGNTCSGQLDEDSGCFGSRGDGNIFRFNTASDCLGVGVRVGGWEVDGYEYGQDNMVYGNTISNAEVGALSFYSSPQGTVCGNSCEDGPCGVIGLDSDSSVLSTWDQPCDSDLTSDMDSDGGEDSGESASDEDDAPTPAPSSAPSSTPAPATPAPADEATPSPSPSPSSPAPTQAPSPSSAVTRSPTPTPTPSPSSGDDGLQQEGDDDEEEMEEQEEQDEEELEEEEAVEDDLGDCDPVTLQPSYVTATSKTQEEHPETALVDGILTNRWSAQVCTIGVRWLRVARRGGDHPGRSRCPTITITTNNTAKNTKVANTNNALSKKKGARTHPEASPLPAHADAAAATAQGAGSWFSIELPEPMVLSGMKLWFEDGDERQQMLTTICVGEGQSVIQEDESFMAERGTGEFFPFQQEMSINSVMVVGYGNTINDWNSINEIQLCKGGQESSRKLHATAGGEGEGDAPGDARELKSRETRSIETTEVGVGVDGSPRSPRIGKFLRGERRN